MGNVYWVTGCEFCSLFEIRADLLPGLLYSFLRYSKWNADITHSTHAEASRSICFRKFPIECFCHSFKAWWKWINEICLFTRPQSMNSELGGVITECGSIRVWNLTTKTLFTSILCTDLFVNAAPSAKLYVTFFHVSESGILYIMLSNGCAYSYNKTLESW